MGGFTSEFRFHLIDDLPPRMVTENAVGACRPATSTHLVDPVLRDPVDDTKMPAGGNAL